MRVVMGIRSHEELLWKIRLWSAWWFALCAGGVVSFCLLSKNVRRSSSLAVALITSPGPPSNLHKHAGPRRPFCSLQSRGRIPPLALTAVPMTGVSVLMESRLLAYRLPVLDPTQTHGRVLLFALFSVRCFIYTQISARALRTLNAPVGQEFEFRIHWLSSHICTYHL